MSIKAMTYIWEHSQQKSTNLLMLLAIADHCNDDGVCYPSVSRLAHKCRLEERSAQKVLRKLEQAGEISIVINDSYHLGKPNLYYLNNYRKSIGLSFVESYTPKRLPESISPVPQDTSNLSYRTPPPPVLQDTSHLSHRTPPHLSYRTP